MTEYRVAYTIATWSGARLVETIKTVPKDSRLLIVDTSQHSWPLAKAWNYACNRLIAQEGFDCVVVMNDDVLIKEYTGEVLAKALMEDQFKGDPLPRELLMTTCRNWRDTAGDVTVFRDASEWDQEWEPGPDFSTFCVGRKLFERVGPFDEGYVPAYFEDNDMHHRIQNAGYEAWAVTPFWHYGSTTRLTDPERRAEVDRTYAKNAARYVAKWGGMPGQETR